MLCHELIIGVANCSSITKHIGSAGGYTKLNQTLIFKKFATQITASKEVLTAGIADSKTAKILHINKGDPVVILNRHSYAKDKGLVEFRITTGRADMFSYRTTIGNNDY